MIGIGARLELDAHRAALRLGVGSGHQPGPRRQVGIAVQPAAGAQGTRGHDRVVGVELLVPVYVGLPVIIPCARTGDAHLAHSLRRVPVHHQIHAALRRRDRSGHARHAGPLQGIEQVAHPLIVPVQFGPGGQKPLGCRHGPRHEAVKPGDPRQEFVRIPIRAGFQIRRHPGEQAVHPGPHLRHRGLVEQQAEDDAVPSSQVFGRHLKADEQGMVDAVEDRLVLEPAETPGHRLKAAPVRVEIEFVVGEIIVFSPAEHHIERVENSIALHVDGPVRIAGESGEAGFLNSGE